MLGLLLDVLPIFFTLFLGYAAGRFHEFGEADAERFNRLVFDFALPALLFTSVMQTTRTSMESYFDLAIITAVILNAVFLTTFFIARLVFRHDRREAAIAGLLCSFPASGFLGMAVLQPLYGVEAGVTVAIVATVSNLTQVPIAMMLISPAGSRPADSALHAVKQPIVFVPVIAVALVFLGWESPKAISNMLDLLGSSSSGVAVFAAGVTISTLSIRLNVEVLWNALAKMLIVPGLLLGALVWWGASKETTTEFTYLAAISPAFTCIVVASRFNIYLENTATTLVLGTLLFAGTAPLWAYVIGLL